MEHPPASEAGALAELGLNELGTAVDGIHKIQRAISERVFRLVGFGVGPAAKPVKVVYDAITDGVYSTISHTMTTAAPIAGKAVHGQAAGKLSDHLESDSLRAAYRAATGDIVVFLHGLIETEAFWALGKRPTYSRRLGTDIGITGVEIRYNTGRHISENGVLLAELLAQLVAAWPVPVPTISLVGHSMGGLVIRSACAVPDRSWVDRVRTVVTLGTPHTGAPLEKGCAFRVGGTERTARDPTLARTPANPIGWVLGDGLVQVRSAQGRSKKRDMRLAGLICARESAVSAENRAQIAQGKDGGCGGHR